MIAFVFPGQGSQVPGMGADWFARTSLSAFIGSLSDAIGVDVKKLCLETDETTLRQTQNAQVALYVTGVLGWQAYLDDGGPEVSLFAGHSIGEYAALAAAGIVSLTDGIKLVQRRGEIMASVGTDRKGAMAAILGLEREKLEVVCAEINDGVVRIANDNCPGQLVISGDERAVMAASEEAKVAGARRAIPLNVSGAFHSPLMHDAAQALGEYLRNFSFKNGKTVVCNVLATPVGNPEEWPSVLERQLEYPVRWTECVQCLTKLGATIFVECGPGEVLGGMIRRIDSVARTLQVSDEKSLGVTLEGLKG